MATTKYAVVNTELMTATDVRSKMRSFRVGTGTGTAFTPIAIENGCVVTLGALIEQDLWEAVVATSSSNPQELVLVTSPEMLYDDRLKQLSDFRNEAGVNCTGMLLQKNDIFSITREGFAGTTEPVVGNYVGIGTDGKLSLSASAPSGVKIGKIIDVKIRNHVKFYGVLVDCTATASKG